MAFLVERGIHVAKASVAKGRAGLQLSCRRWRRGALALLASTVAWFASWMGMADSAGATMVYGNFAAADVMFLGVQETSSFGDPEPLFGAPTGVAANSLLFTPTTFSASAAGNLGYDETGSQLQATIMATNLSLPYIQKVILMEFGDTFLSGVGTAATGTFASMSGFVTVLETSSGACVGASCILGFTGVFTPSDLLGLPANVGTTNWSGAATIDVAASFPTATKVQVSWDNDLYAYSETGTSALIQKKVGTKISVVVPEPATALLVGGGLFAFVLRARRSRRS